MKRRLARLDARRSGVPYPAWTESPTIGELQTGITKSADMVLDAEAERAIEGKTGFFTVGEAHDAAAKVAKECDAIGIDPSWDLRDRVARLQDIHQGSPLMTEERRRKADYFHTTLKEKLGQE